MTKAEQQRLLEAESLATINRALRWSEQSVIAPDLPVPGGGEHTQGFIYIVHTKVVVAMWSENTRHGSGPWTTNADRPNRSASRDGIRLYSSRALALRALRCALEQNCARSLALIDEQIAEEESA